MKMNDRQKDCIEEIRSVGILLSNLQETILPSEVISRIGDLITDLIETVSKNPSERPID